MLYHMRSRVKLKACVPELKQFSNVKIKQTVFFFRISSFKVSSTNTNSSISTISFKTGVTTSFAAASSSESPRYLSAVRAPAIKMTIKSAKKKAVNLRSRLFISRGDFFELWEAISHNWLSFILVLRDIKNGLSVIYRWFTAPILCFHDLNGAVNG